MSDCPIIIGDPAVSFVGGGYSTFLPLATSQVYAAQNSIASMASLQVQPFAFTVGFDFDGSLVNWRQPERPNRPASSDFDIAEIDIADPPGFSPGNVTVDAAPTFNTATPNLQFGAKPTRPAIAEPGSPPNLNLPSAPLPPDYELPEVPTLEMLLIPDRPDLTIPVFDDELADPDFTVPLETWSFIPDEYASALLERIKSKLGEIMDGSTGLPVAIEQALFDRARQRVSVEEQKAIQQTVDEFSTRGFEEPNGVLSARLAEVRQNGQNSRNEIVRDIAIQGHTAELEQLRFAVTQGVALEGVMVGLFAQMQDLHFRSVSFARDTAIAIFNARVALYNTLASAFDTRARVYETRIRALLAEVEIFKAEIDAERLRGEINEQRVRIYAERIRALNAMAELYRAEVAGFSAAADVEIKRMDGYRSEVQAFGERVRAWGIDVEAYGQSVNAELGKTTAHRTLADVFATRTNAWAQKNTIGFEAERLRVQQFDTETRAWDGTLRKSLAELQAAQTRVQALAQFYTTDGSIYAAEGQVEAAASAAKDRTFQLGVERERSRTDVLLKFADIKVNENIQLTQIQQRILETVAQVQSQLAAALSSAVNFSTQVSSSATQQRGCTTSFDYRGQI